MKKKKRTIIPKLNRRNINFSYTWLEIKSVARGTDGHFSNMCREMETPLSALSFRGQENPILFYTSVSFQNDDIVFIYFLSEEEKKQFYRD